MKDNSIQRRSFIKSLLVGVPSIYLFGCRNREHYYNELESKFFYKGSFEKQREELKNLEEATIKNTYFFEEYKHLEEFVKELDVPEIGLDSNINCAGFIDITDKILMPEISTKLWIHLLRKGLPVLHNTKHHERLHLLADHYSERDKFDDMVCQYIFKKRDVTYQEFKDTVEQFETTLTNSKVDDFRELLLAYQKLYNIEGSMQDILDSLKKKVDSLKESKNPRLILLEAHAKFVAPSEPIYEKKLPISEIKARLSEDVKREIRYDFPNKNIDILHTINNICILYGLLLSKGVSVPEANISVAKIVGRNLDSYDSETSLYPNLEKSLERLYQRYNMPPEKALKVIESVWIPYKVSISKSVRRATEKFLRDNFG